MLDRADDLSTATVELWLPVRAGLTRDAPPVPRRASRPPGRRRVLTGSGSGSGSQAPAREVQVGVVGVGAGIGAGRHGAGVPRTEQDVLHLELGRADEEVAPVPVRTPTYLDV